MMQLTNEQWMDLRGDLITRTAEMISAKYAGEVLEELGMFLGAAAGLPVSLVARITGWNDKWIRRNLPVVKAEGQFDSVMLCDVKEAIFNRKDK